MLVFIPLKAVNEYNKSFIILDYLGHSDGLGIGYMSNTLFDLKKINSNVNLQTTLGGAYITLLNLRILTFNFNYNINLPNSNFYASIKTGFKLQLYKRNNDEVNDIADGLTAYPLLDFELSYIFKEMIIKVYYPLSNQNASYSFPGLNVGWVL